ncbi:MAG: hypothetical protein LBD23_02620 [Oscillospiraceae bacterium]|jgi:hypothetical protein|nr:hypothetical protein [Oscillospiraceae bacterium]
MDNNKEIMTLCSVCVKEFRDCNVRKIRRTSNQNRDVCTYCQFRKGYDYKYVEEKKIR